MSREMVDWPNGMKFIQDDRLFKLTTDSVLLSAFACVKRCRLACELGCGIGGLALLLAKRAPQLKIDCIEIQSEAVEIARENVLLNGFEESVRILCGDLRADNGLRAGSYDLVVCNPPYFVRGSGKPASVGSIEAARADENCTLDDVCKAAARLLKWGGRFALVFRAERMVDLFCTLRGSGMEPKRLRRIADRPGRVPELILVEARRGAAPALVHEPDLIVREEDGRYTKELLENYGRA